MKQEFHISITKNDKAVNIIAEHSKLSKQQIKTAMKKGAVWLEDIKSIHRIRRADTVLPLQSTLHFYYASNVLEAMPPTPTLIADEMDYSVWNKPCGMFSQGSKWSDHCTLHRWIEINQPFETNPQRNCFIVNRLDRAARGLMLIAHKKTVAAKLAELFSSRNIAKSYRAIIEGKFPTDEQIFDSEIDGKTAYSSASLLEYSADKNQSLVKIDIKTGRKHQIRIHMNRASYPIVGDRLHGTASKDYEIDLQLSSFSLKFICPITNKPREYILPKNLQLEV